MDDDAGYTDELARVDILPRPVPAGATDWADYFDLIPLANDVFCYSGMTNVEPDVEEPSSFAYLASPDRESVSSYEDETLDSDGAEHSTADAESTRSETSTASYDRMFTPSAEMIAQHKSELLRRGDGHQEEDDLHAHLRALDALLEHESVHVPPGLADYAALVQETPMGSMASDHPKC